MISKKDLKLILDQYNIQEEIKQHIYTDLKHHFENKKKKESLSGWVCPNCGIGVNPDSDYCECKQAKYGSWSF